MHAKKKTDIKKNYKYLNFEKSIRKFVAYFLLDSDSYPPESCHASLYLHTDEKPICGFATVIAKYCFPRDFLRTQ